MWAESISRCRGAPARWRVEGMINVFFYFCSYKLIKNRLLDQFFICIFFYIPMGWETNPVMINPYDPPI